jgi:integrase
LLGRLEPRSRVLRDEELRRIWNASDAVGYPIGPLFRLLILTGARLNEGCDATWDEVDLKRGIWTIPAPRMKGRIEHHVPITAMLREVFDGLPRLKGGPYMFSTGDGSKSLWVSEHHRGKVDLAARVYDWRNHDIEGPSGPTCHPSPTFPSTFVS